MREMGRRMNALVSLAVVATCIASASAAQRRVTQSITRGGSDVEVSRVSFEGFSGVQRGPVRISDGYQLPSPTTDGYDEAEGYGDPALLPLLLGIPRGGYVPFNGWVYYQFNITSQMLSAGNVYALVTGLDSNPDM